MGNDVVVSFGPLQTASCEVGGCWKEVLVAGIPFSGKKAELTISGPTAGAVGSLSPGGRCWVANAFVSDLAGPTSPSHSG